MLICVDPGGNSAAWAVFKEGRLFSAGFITNKSKKVLARQFKLIADSFRPTSAVVEIPQVYSQRSWKGDPNDLISVALVAGMFIDALAAYVEPVTVRPHAWKGNRPKQLDNKFTLSRLDSIEKSHLEMLRQMKLKKSEVHNVIDAIGIGLWQLRR